MSLSIESETAWLQSLTAADRARFLASLSHGLTISVRVLCHCGGNTAQTIEWVRQLNEAHHRVTSYLSHHHTGDEHVGWIAVIVDFILNSKEPAVLQQIEHVWALSRKAMSHGEQV